jgi:Ser/Thr protein kinase RdoA (MazF antagonist)
MADNIVSSIVENYHLRIIKTENLFEGEGCHYRIVDDTGNIYILKVYQDKEELISFITTILTYLEKSDIKIHFPRPVKNIKGMNYVPQADKTLVIFHWIEGTTMEFVNTKIAEELGEVVSILDNNLYEFYLTHEWDYSKYEDSKWSVTNIHKFDEDLDTIKQLLGDHYRLIKETIADFDKEYPAVQKSLYKSLIHNDINLSNLLYDQQSKLIGIIDFTEISHTHRICEAAVALAYVMQVGGIDYLKIGQSFIQGYAKSHCFTKNEQDVLLLFTKLRLSITIIYNTMRQHFRKEETDVQARYICNAKNMLSKLSETTNNEFVEKLFPPDEGK